MGEGDCSEVVWALRGVKSRQRLVKLSAGQACGDARGSIAMLG